MFLHIGMYVRTITRFLPPEEAVKSRGLFNNRAEELEFVSRVPMGGGYVLRKLWERLGLDKAIAGALKEREFRTPVERAFRTMKTTLELRPVYHRKDESIWAHVLICFLALVLVRICERQTGLSWNRIRTIMDRVHLVTFESKDGRILQRTELTPEQSNILKKQNIPHPPKVCKVNLKG